MPKHTLEQRFANTKALFFDIDGVLVSNFMSVITQSSQLVMIMRGEVITPQRAIEAQLKHIRTDDILEELVHPAPDEWPRVRELHQRIFRQNSFMPPIGNPGKFVQDVRDSGRQTALWTSRPAEFLTEFSCAGFVFDDDDPFRLFNAVHTSKGGRDDKPHPNSLRQLARQLAIPQEEYGKIVVVEDMPQNIRAAQELGMLTVGVASGILGTDPVAFKRMEAMGPDLLLDSYEELRPFLNLPA